MVQGLWARAAAKARDTGQFAREVEALAGMANGSDGHFFEIYNGLTGKPDGGGRTGGIGVRPRIRPGRRRRISR